MDAIEAKIAELEGLLAKATKGPWAADDGDADIWGIFDDASGDPLGYLAEPNPSALHGFQRLDRAQENALLIVEAVNSLPLLLFALKEAREALAGLLAFKLAAIHEPGKPYQGGLKQAVERARQALTPEPPHA